MGYRIVFGASEEKQRAFLAEHPELGTFEERQKRFIAEVQPEELVPADPEYIRNMRKDGRKNAGRRAVDIIADNINSPGLLAQTKHDSLDVIYSVLEDRYENSYLDFLAHNFPEIIEEIKVKYGGIPQVVKSRYGDVFADFDDAHLIDTISRLTPEEVYNIYLVDRKSDAMIHFLERNFLQILEEIKVRHELPKATGSSSKCCLNPLISGQAYPS